MNALATVLASIAGFAAHAAVIDVPGDQPTIQAAINAAANGDEIVVAPGTYTEAIDFLGKAITIRSTDGPSFTVIDAAGVPDPGAGVPVVRIQNGEGPDSVLEGFSLLNGIGDTTIFSSTLGNGTAVFVRDSHPTIRDCVIENYVSTPGQPEVFGVIYVTGSAGLNLEDSIIRSNSSNFFPGVLFDNIVGEIEISDCTFIDLLQSGSNGGSAVNVRGAISAQISITDSVFSSNATSAGTVRLEGNTNQNTVSFERCDFIENFGSGNFDFDAIAAMVMIPNTSFSECRFIDNENAGQGVAAIFSEDPFSVRRSVFEGNTSPNGVAGAIYAPASSAVIEQSLFVANSSFGASSVLGTVKIANSVFVGNQGTAALIDASAHNCIFRDNTGGPIAIGSSQIEHSIVQGGFPGTGNIDADPLFVDQAGGDFRLLPGSPAIDAGSTTAAAALPVSDFDLDGKPRVVDDPAVADTGISLFGLPIIDMGAFEFQADPEPECIVDLDDNGLLNFFDFVEFIDLFNAGCP